MAIFQYKILNNSGRVVTGVSEFSFSSRSAVFGHFEQLGHSVIYVKPVIWFLSWFYVVMFWIEYRRIKKEDIVEFVRSIAIMLKSGIPINDAIVDAGEYINNPSLTKVITDLKISIESGAGLSGAFAKHPRLFPESIVYLARMGEESGLLDETLMNAADNMRRISRIGVDVKKALIYPAFALIATTAAVIFWLQFTVPSLAGLYSMMQVELPAATQMVIKASKSLEANYLLYFMLLVAFIASVKLLINRNQRIRYRFHQLLMYIPVVNLIIRYSNMTFIFEYFSMLLRAGVDAYTTLGVMSNSLTNEVYKKAIEDVRMGVTQGNSISYEILRCKEFPRFVGRMVKTGESSGTLDEQLRYIADEYRLKLNDIIDRLKTLIEPVAIILIGGLMLLIIGTLFFPIYQLIGTIGVGGAR